MTQVVGISEFKEIIFEKHWLFYESPILNFSSLYYIVKGLKDTGTIYMYVDRKWKCFSDLSIFVTRVHYDRSSVTQNIAILHSNNG